MNMSLRPQLKIGDIFARNLVPLHVALGQLESVCDKLIVKDYSRRYDGWVEIVLMDGTETYVSISDLFGFWERCRP